MAGKEVETSPAQGEKGGSKFFKFFREFAGEVKLSWATPKEILKFADRICGCRFVRCAYWRIGLLFGLCIKLLTNL